MGIVRSMRLTPYLAVLPLAACGGGDGSSGSGASLTPWAEDQVTIVSPSGEVVIASAPPEGECVDVPEFGCVYTTDTAGRCEAGEAADVILDADGEVLDVVCLPSDAVTITPENLVDGELPQEANHIAVEIEGSFEDDLGVDGNGVVLYGDDPDDAVIEGNLDIDGNNAVVRGLTIDGDVTIEKNDATFVFCRITGDVTIVGNNTLISGCEVFGDVILEGNSTVLNGNLFGGMLDVRGNNTDCSGEANRAFSDANEDGAVDEDEIGDDVGC